ncbi:MAG TPA: hypothetical protein VGH73_22920 [Thermoanaerobaculia bacterium]
MPRRSSERGEGNLGCILWMLALGLATLIAWKAIPVKIQSTELYDFMDEQAKFSAARTPPDQIAKAIIDRAHQLDIQMDKQDVRVERNGDRIFIDVEYTVPLEFPGYTYQWHFHQKLDRPIFIV